MTPRVLLTGVGGFVGSHVLRHLLVETDWEVVALDSFRHRGLTERVRVQLDGCDTSRVSVLQHDLRVPIGPLLAHEIGEIDYVLNLASDSHVDRSLAHPREFVENNVALMLTMLDWARTHPVSAFVQISTDEVYGPAERGHEHAEEGTAGADRVAGPHRGLDAGPPAVAGAVSDAQVAGAGPADRARHHLHGGRDSRAVPARGHPH
jgi:dTDP-glucose 4,6-dehydratase